MKTLLAGILSFVATNLDDVLILMMLFAQAVGARARLRITLGQYLGIFILFMHKQNKKMEFYAF